MGIKLEPTADMLKGRRLEAVRRYFKDCKEAERIKIEHREMILRDINSGKYDHIIFKR